MSKYTEMKLKLDILKKDMEATIKDALREAFAEFFDKHPMIQSIGWTQYTPYFNDGDECLFRVHSDADYGIEVDGIKGHSIQGLVKYSRETSAAYYKERNILLKDHEEVENLLEQFDAEDMKTAFGDHVHVTAKRDGTTEIEEYDHD